MRLFIGTLSAVAMLATSALVPTNAADNTVTIGAIYPTKTLTGEQGRRSSQFAVDEINTAGGLLGKKLEIVVYDDAFQPAQGTAAIRRLMSEDHVKLLTGGISTAVVNAAMVVVDQNGGLMLSAVTKSPDLTSFKYGFRLNSLAATDMTDLGKVLDETVKPKRVAILADISDYGNFMISRLKSVYGDRIVGVEQYEVLAQTDFSTLVTKLKTLNPDATCLGFVAAEQGAAILRAMSEAGVPGARCVVPGALTPQVVAAAGDAAEGAMSVNDWTADLNTPENKVFVDAFRAKFHELPGNVDFLAYVSVKILAGAIKAAGTADDVAKVATAIEQGSWDTPIGLMTFKDHQAVGGKPLLIKVKDGQLVTVQ